jgi:hypothetical protein
VFFVCCFYALRVFHVLRKVFVCFFYGIRKFYEKSNMPMNFASQLSEELSTDGRTRAEQAKEFGISPSNLSQFCSGKEPCGEKQLARILAKMPADARARLAAAWLRDRIPELIPPGHIVITTDLPIANEEADVYWPEVDPELRNEMIQLLRRAVQHREIREALLSFGRALRN